MSKSLKIVTVIIAVVITGFFVMGTIAIVGTVKSQAITDTGLPRLDV